ncbi:universal stress protein [Oceanospirillum sanctuarii]|uniref:universal stress protein n=1 Tax=Oceanospirillum sanctuarii TaxID=1434821 RepID=UPI0015938E9B|nr:universal stress protein [Oceanospirillum sanctuarii]
MKRFNKILCLIQLDGAEDLLKKALQIAEQSSASLTLQVMLPGAVSALAAEQDNPEQKVRQRLLSQLETSPALVKQIEALPILLCPGKPVIEAVSAVVREGFDLVLKEAEDPDWMDRLMGSDDNHLLRKCPCPVWLFKPGAPKPLKNIMVALDFDHTEHPENVELNQTLAELGLSLASSESADLHLVSVYESLEAGMLSIWSEEPEAFRRTLETAEYERKQKGMSDLKQALERKVGKESYDYIAPVTHLVQGLPAKKLTEMAEQLDVDLVIMGTLARSGLKGIVIGNTAESVLGALKCSVLTVKPSGFVSPLMPD